MQYGETGETGNSPMGSSVLRAWEDTQGNRTHMTRAEALTSLRSDRLSCAQYQEALMVF